MDRGLYNLDVLLDLKKAFDTVNHGILLKKLQMYGFETRALNFMRDYLSNIIVTSKSFVLLVTINN